MYQVYAGDVLTYVSTQGCHPHPRKGVHSVGLVGHQPAARSRNLPRPSLTRNLEIDELTLSVTYLYDD